MGQGVIAPRDTCGSNRSKAIGRTYGVPKWPIDSKTLLPGQISGQGGSQGLENVIQAGDGKWHP
jgi:hypothetical protein